MVHALKEAHRVLRPEGLLIDLRPAAEHRRVGLGANRNWRLVGVMRESLEEDRAANAAIHAVIRGGLFRTLRRSRFSLDREADSVDELRSWLEDFTRIEKYGDHEWLVRRVERACKAARRKPKITIRGRMTLGVLQSR